MAFDEIKNIDATKKAAVSQVSGSFNPLTAGQDKTEAQRLLGIKKKKKKKDAEFPFYKRVPFQVAALVSILAFTGFMLLVPKSHQKIVDEAKALIESKSSSKWNQARIEIAPVMKGDGPLAAEAEDLYYQSFRKSLVYHAEQGRSTRLDSENVQLFSKAVRHEQNEELAEATKIYLDLVDLVDPEGKERHVYRESETRLAKLNESQELPRSQDQLGELIIKARNATSSDQLVKAHDLLVRIQLQFAGEEGYEVVVQQASRELEIVKGKIADENQLVDEIDEVAPDTGEAP